MSASVSTVDKEKLAAEQKVQEACQNFFCDKYGPNLDEDVGDEESDSSRVAEAERITDGGSTWAYRGIQVFCRVVCGERETEELQRHRGRPTGLMQGLYAEFSVGISSSYR